jgi:hypothetical protein
VRSIAALPAKAFVLDGEIVALTEDGLPSFQALQHRTTAKLALVYYAFDLLSVDGTSWLRRPIEARRERLAAIVDGSEVLLSSTLDGDPASIEMVIRELRLEGVATKRRGSIYRPGQRTDDRIKARNSAPRQVSMLVKLYGSAGETRYSPAKCLGCIPQYVSGDPDPAHVSTSYVEDQNLTMRISMRRFTRLTNAFSKKLENHAMVALYFHVLPLRPGASNTARDTSDGIWHRGSHLVD